MAAVAAGCDDGIMETGTALILIFALWFGWSRYAEHKAAAPREPSGTPAPSSSPF
jgi:hypothetical protein